MSAAALMLTAMPRSFSVMTWAVNVTGWTQPAACWKPSTMQQARLLKHGNTPCFDAAGQVIETRQYTVFVATASITDQASLATALGSLDAIVTQYTYDDDGRLVETEVDPAGLAITRSMTYDDNGNVVTSTDGNGRVTAYTYDTLNREVYRIDPLGHVTETQYDTAGRVTAKRLYAQAIT